MKIDETCAALTEKHKVEVGHNNNVKLFITTIDNRNIPTKWYETCLCNVIHEKKVQLNKCT